jgi:putative PIN family toxin of toxin-antitoxin system
MIKKRIKVIFVTKIWISFLIGKRLLNIKNFICSGNIIIVVTPQLINEIKIVTQREKLKKYFNQNDVNGLIDLMETISLNVDIKEKHLICRDPKDNFLLDLIEFSNADFLVTGDKDLLELNPFKSGQIINPKDFERYLIQNF